jgi:hypothetical protein
MHRTMRIPSHRSGEASLHCRSSYKTIRRLNYQSTVNLYPHTIMNSPFATVLHSVSSSLRNTLSQNALSSSHWTGYIDYRRPVIVFTTTNHMNNQAWFFNAWRLIDVLAPNQLVKLLKLGRWTTNTTQSISNAWIMVDRLWVVFLEIVEVYFNPKLDG